MILQMQAKVHGLGNLGVSTCTYPILSKFKATFRILILITINFCYSRMYMRTRHDYDDKFLYSRSYSGSRADYDDKFLYSRSIHA